MEPDPEITVTIPTAAAANILNRLEREYGCGFKYWHEDPGTGPILTALFNADYRERGGRLIAPGEVWYDIKRGWVLY
jgi:hypothetical protein